MITTNTTDRLNQILITSLEQAQGVLDKGVEFAMQQAPLLVQEFLNYSFYSNLFYAAIYGFGVLIVWGICLKYLKALWNYDRRNDSGWSAILCGTLIISFIVLFDTCIPRAMEAVRIKIAPRVVLVEYVRSLK